MDPISILAAATSASKAVISLSTGLYGFIESIRNVDENVRGLQSEALALNAILEAIKGTLSTLPQAQNSRLRDHNPTLWAAISQSLQDCDITVGGFRSSINAVGNHNTSVVKMISLKFREDGLVGLRTQIRTHTTALNLALQTITIHLSSTGPGVVIDDIGQRIDLVVDMMAQMGMSHDLSPTPRQDTAAEIAPTNIENLVESVRQVVVEANEVINRSEQGSVFGGSLKPQTQARIEEWIEMYDSEAGSKTVDMSSTISDSRWTPDTSDAANSDYTVVGNHLDMEGDSDDEFEMEEFESCLKLADAAFKEKQFSSAGEFYQKTCGLGKLLSTARQNTLPYRDIFLKIATCLYHQKKLEEAEQAIVRVKEGPMVTKEDTIRYLQATNLLAEIFLMENKFEDAFLECRKAVKGRRRALGKESPDYYESLSLLAIIVEERGDSVAAQTYRAMIPDTAEAAKPFRRKASFVPSRIPQMNPTEKEDAIQFLKKEYLRIEGNMKYTGTNYNTREALLWSCGGKKYEGPLYPSVTRLLLSGWLPNQSPHAFPNWNQVEIKITPQDINERILKSRTMLFRVAKMNNQSEETVRTVVSLLIKAGGDPDLTDAYGQRQRQILMLGTEKTKHHYTLPLAFP